MALSNEGVEAVRGGDSRKETIAQYTFNGTTVKCYATIKTKVTEYHGMPEAQAETKANGFSSDNRSDYIITGTISGFTCQMRCPKANGTKVSGSWRREGNSRMFTVTKTEETYIPSNNMGW